MVNCAKVWFILLGIFLFTSGCVGTRYLKENETLLYKQKIKVNKPINKDALKSLHAQSPNRQFPMVPFSPYVWFYQVGIRKFDKNKLEAKKQAISEKYDTLIKREKKSKKKNRLLNKKNTKLKRVNRTIKEGNVWMRWGEPLAVYDTALTKKTKQNLQLYLHSIGYFDATIDVDEQVNGKLVKLNYTVNQRRPYVIDYLAIKISDSMLSNTLNQRKPLIKIGENYIQKTLTDERQQIFDLFKNNGYYNFSKQYISFDVDTTFGDHKVAIRTHIKNPINAKNHTKFYIDSINFVVNHSNGYATEAPKYQAIYNETKFIFHQPYYSTKVLHRRTFIKKGNQYSKQLTFDTQRQLANLDVFKFININYDTTQGRFITNIFTQPLPRYQWTNEFGVNVNQGLPGPFYNTTFKKRNIFRGLENFEISGRIGIEGVASASDETEVFRSVEVGANASIIFPQFVWPLRSKTREWLAKYNPKTKITIGYAVTNRPEYNRKNGNFTATYSWGKRLSTLYQFSIADISIINSSLTTAFKERLNSLSFQGSNLLYTFLPSFVNSVSFSITKNTNKYGSGKHKSSFIQLFLESGGVAKNWIANSIFKSQKLETYRFAKINFDFRKIIPIEKKAAVAFRINAGVAIPYGENKALPYEKYFFAGGSNGIRGWRPRRLGPGSYTPINKKGNLSYKFEQQGELLIQSSIEFRRNLIGFLDWAYFIDAGNIWTLREDNSRPGAQFKVDSFYKEIAIASGLGLRFDFVFVIIRLDAGLKIFDPARAEGKRFIFSSGFYDPPFDNTSLTEPIIFNIGIGYPF